MIRHCSKHEKQFAVTVCTKKDCKHFGAIVCLKCVLKEHQGHQEGDFTLVEDVIEGSAKRVKEQKGGWNGVHINVGGLRQAVQELVWESSQLLYKLDQEFGGLEVSLGQQLQKEGGFQSMDFKRLSQLIRNQLCAQNNKATFDEFVQMVSKSQKVLSGVFTNLNGQIEKVVGKSKEEWVKQPPASISAHQCKDNTLNIFAKSDQNMVNPFTSSKMSQSTQPSESPKTDNPFMAANRDQIWMMPSKHQNQQVPAKVESTSQNPKPMSFNPFKLTQQSNLIEGSQNMFEKLRKMAK